MSICGLDEIRLVAEEYPVPGTKYLRNTKHRKIPKIVNAARFRPRVRLRYPVPGTKYPSIPLKMASLLPFPPSAALGRRQVVRQGFLVPSFVGSNPAAPTSRYRRLRKVPEAENTLREGAR